jgi:hypothetical protein
MSGLCVPITFVMPEIHAISCSIMSCFWPEYVCRVWNLMSCLVFVADPVLNFRVFFRIVSETGEFSSVEKTMRNFRRNVYQLTLNCRRDLGYVWNYVCSFLRHVLNFVSHLSYWVCFFYMRSKVKNVDFALFFERLCLKRASFLEYHVYNFLWYYWLSRLKLLVA